MKKTNTNLKSNKILPIIVIISIAFSALIYVLFVSFGSLNLTYGFTYEALKTLDPEVPKEMGYLVLGYFYIVVLALSIPQAILAIVTLVINFLKRADKKWLLLMVCSIVAIALALTMYVLIPVFNVESGDHVALVIYGLILAILSCASIICQAIYFFGKKEPITE